MRNKSQRILAGVGLFILTAMLTLIGLVSIPVFFCDQFVVNGESMEPTLYSGDHILVNKLKLGARIYKDYDFTHSRLKSFRMPSLGKVRAGDIVVFNYPDAYGRHKIEFRINYVYTKRCIGRPGDTVEIRNGRYHNRSLPGMRMVPANAEDSLSNSSDSAIALRGNILKAFPRRGGLGWTIRNLGPMLVPKKGSTITLDSTQAYVYARAIEYETGCRPKVSDGKVFIGGKETSSYTFTHNYYFFGGDNVLNSKDSRYFGIVPEEYVVGVVTRILFSKNPVTGKEVRGRTLKKTPNLDNI